MFCACAVGPMAMPIPDSISGYVITYTYQVSNHSEQVEFYAWAVGPMVMSIPDLASGYVITYMYQVYMNNRRI